MSYTRFAIYYIPPEGSLATFGAKWLGWDVITGTNDDSLNIPELDDTTMTPRKYGFHGTLKPPFRLADGYQVEDLTQAISAMAKRLSRVRCDGLGLSQIGHFLALTPTGDLQPLSNLARACVVDLDMFRRPADATEIERRRASGLSARQDANLLQWGYPYVLEDFKFHLTLTGRLKLGEMSKWKATVAEHMPALLYPFDITSVALVGERPDGRFELIQRYDLSA
ncbi:MAG: DUF1045 domain-containing protein [Halocynthiibacter sp.]